MKKQLTLIVAAIAILFSACTKDNETPIINDSVWTFNGVGHFAVKSARTDASDGAAAKIVFTDTNVDRDASLTVFFKALPKTEGSYTLVAGSGAGLKDNEIAVVATEKTLTNIMYSGTTSVPVQVTITKDGKIQVNIPEVTLSQGGGGSETYKLSANVFEASK